MNEDVLLKVFSNFQLSSNVDQKALVTCTLVCRDWYNAVIQVLYQKIERNRKAVQVSTRPHLAKWVKEIEIWVYNEDTICQTIFPNLNTLKVYQYRNHCNLSRFLQSHQNIISHLYTETFSYPLRIRFPLRSVEIRYIDSRCTTRILQDQVDIRKQLETDNNKNDDNYENKDTNNNNNNIIIATPMESAKVLTTSEDVVKNCLPLLAKLGITELQLRGFILFDDIFVDLCRILGPTLKCLDVYMDKSVTELGIIEAHPLMEKLEKLHVTGNIDVLDAILTHLPNIKSLAFAGSKRFVYKRHLNLTQLKIPEINITNIRVSEFANSLPNLVHLEIKDATGKEFGVISRLVSLMPKLNRLIVKFWYELFRPELDYIRKRIANDPNAYPLDCNYSFNDFMNEYRSSRV